MKSLKNILNKKKFQMRSPARPELFDEKLIENVFFEKFKIEFPSLSRSDIEFFQYKEGKIFLKLSHPAIAVDVWRARSKFVRKINNFLQHNLIREIRVK